MTEFASAQEGLFGSDEAIFDLKLSLLRRWQIFLKEWLCVRLAMTGVEGLRCWIEWGCEGERLL